MKRRRALGEGIGNGCLDDERLGVVTTVTARSDTELAGQVAAHGNTGNPVWTTGPIAVLGWVGRPARCRAGELRLVRPFPAVGVVVTLHEWLDREFGISLEVRAGVDCARATSASRRSYERLVSREELGVDDAPLLHAVRWFGARRMSLPRTLAGMPPFPTFPAHIGCSSTASIVESQPMSTLAVIGRRASSGSIPCGLRRTMP